MIMGVPYDAEIAYLELNGVRVDIPSGMIPVRVGSGTNAVGYIYDRATRKLIGATGGSTFVLGPDVARPVMGLRKFTPTARNYVQDGLVAMWDGIENAGWGVHQDGIVNWVDCANGIVINNTKFRFYSNYLSQPNKINSVNNARCNDSRVLNLVRTGTDISIELIYKKMGAYGTVDGLLYIATGWNAGFCFLTGTQTSKWSSSGFGAQQITNDETVTSTSQTLLSATELKTYHNGVNISTTVGSYLADVNRVFGLFEYNQGTVSISNLYAVRLYNRALTAAEIAANYAIDKIRFNLP